MSKDEVQVGRCGVSENAMSSLPASRVTMGEQSSRKMTLLFYRFTGWRKGTPGLGEVVESCELYRALWRRSWMIAGRRASSSECRPRHRRRGFRRKRPLRAA